MTKKLFTRVKMHTRKGWVRNDTKLETWDWPEVSKGDRVTVPGVGMVEVTHVHVSAYGADALKQEVTFNNPNE